MRTGFNRLTSIVLMIGAIFGLILSLYGLYALWTIKPAITSGISELVDLADRTLDATENMLQVMDTSLDQAVVDLSLMRQILVDSGQTIGQSTSTIDDTAKLMGESLPQIIVETQDALIGTQTTAGLIDDMLSTLSNIPLIGPSLGSRYRPEVPLRDSIAQVNRSLDALPDSFVKIQRDMNTASAGMSTMKGELEALSRQVADIEQSIQAAQKEVKAYQLILADVRDRLESLNQRVPLLVDTVYLAVTIVLIWLGISQLGVLLQSAELFTRSEPQ
jgi:methyl-accepting chemotaxis protein